MLKSNNNLIPNGPKPKKAFSRSNIIIYSTLILLEKNPQNYNEYINGINSILNPINSQIKKWINDNIVF